MTQYFNDRGAPKPLYEYFFHKKLVKKTQGIETNGNTCLPTVVYAQNCYSVDKPIVNYCMVQENKEQIHVILKQHLTMLNHKS